VGRSTEKTNQLLDHRRCKMTPPLEIQSKRVVLRLRTSEFDNGKPDVIYEIAGAYLEFSGRSREEITQQDKHYVHWEPPQRDPRRYFHIAIDMDYRIKTPDLETVRFDFVRVNHEL
jgi:hypothetical protein